MWKEKENSLQRSFVFKDFQEAFAFMLRVAFLAEGLNHHPTWENTYNQVHIRLCTHEAGNTITAKDRTMAEKIDEIFEALPKSSS